MKQRKIFLAAGLLICLTAVFGFIKIEDTVINRIATQLGKWTANNPQEKVYLHMDKPYYAIGDDIWFKAYITTGAKHQLSAISGILNVELIDDRDSIKRALKLPISNGLTWGDFKLTDSLKEGNYRIRAYTNYMRNFNDAYFFDKTIQVGSSINNKVFAKATYTYHTVNNQQMVNTVINYTDINGTPYAGKEVSYEVVLNSRPVNRGKGVTDNAGNLSFTFPNKMPALFKSGSITTNLKVDVKQFITKILPVKATSNRVDVQFFPEGGYLVNGIRSRVAFKAVGADGLGVDVKGVIIDNQSNQVAELAARHLGMGVFSLMPESGKTYTAKINYPDGSLATVNLPAATEKGYVLSVYNKTESVDVKIALNQATYQDNQNAEINLVAQCSGEVVYAAKTTLQSTSFSTRIPKSRFRSGIVQFTLFSGKGEPLNQRVAFIQNPDLLNLNLNSDKGNYNPREKVKLNIDAKNKDNQPVVGVFSVAVTDETKVPVDEDSENTILSNILLTSDLKGYIEKPNYYFTNVSEKTQADLDALMLTQGYRRFEWKQVMADVFPPMTFQPEKTLDISGHLKTLSGKIVPHGKVSLFTTAGGMFYLDTVTDDKGNFTFKNLVFTDSIKFVIQARTGKDKKNVEISLDNISPQMVSHNKNSADIEVNINSGMAAYLQNSKKQYDDFLKYGLITRSNMMKEVSVTDKRKPIENSSNLNGAGNADQVIKADQLQSCTTLEQCLSGRLLGVIFRNGVPYSTRNINGPPMGLVVDGMRMEPDFFDSINIFDIETIEVLRSISYTAIYGSQGAGGLLVITTKRGDSGSSYQRYSPGIITYSPLGYYRARQFYSPRYDDPKTNAKVADLRTTIYWKPNIVTDKTGNASFDFFTADTKGSYRAVIEGLDVDGNLGRQVFKFKVE